MKSVSDRSTAVQGSAEIVAVVGGTIIDGSGGAPVEDGVILVEGQRISAVGDRSIPIPPNAKQIRAAGKFVIPGLMAPHQYLVEGTWPPEMIRYEGRYDEVAIEAAQLALKGGITTIFDNWGPRDPLIEARDSINAGRAVGARIYLCGNWIGGGGPYSADMRPQFKEALGNPFANRINALWELNVGEELTRMPLEEVRQQVRHYVHSGIDFVNYPVNVHRNGSWNYITFSQRVQRMIVEEAHRAGLPVQANYITTEEGIHAALDAGVDSVALFPWGGKPTTAETWSLLAEKGIPIYFSVFSTDLLEWFRAQSNTFPGAREYMEVAEIDHRALIGTNALLTASAPGGVYTEDQLEAWGSQMAPENYSPLGEGHVRGLRSLQQKGMTPMGALMTATRNVARAFKVEKDLGTLERDKLADLVILNANPLENVQHYLDIHLVMKEGRVVDRDSLPTQRLWTASPVESN